MSKYVGADWASKGWATSVLEDRGLRTEFHPTVWNLWHEHDDADQILVDIPIGLPEGNRRPCDAEAKEFLRNRGSSVFWTPIREAVEMDDFDAAKDIQENKIGHRISNQTWGIVPQIREVDVFLRENDHIRGTIRESHPEVCFRKLSDKPLKSKSDDDGIDDRKGVLCDNLGIETSECERAIQTLTEPNYMPWAAEDDVLDSIVLAETARFAAVGEYGTFPENPSKDSKDLSMEIVYPDPDTRPAQALTAPRSKSPP